MNIHLISALIPEDTVAGPVVLYRHFKDLKNHKIHIFTHEFSGLLPSNQNWDEYRIKYNWLAKLIRRAFFRKISYIIGEYLLSQWVIRNMRPHFEKSSPDVIITTWFSTFIIPAYYFSKKHKIPLIIICHDDLESQIQSNKWLSSITRKILKKIYQHASQRLVVSEGMNNVFYKRYGVKGKVLPPIGGNVVSPPPIISEIDNSEKLVFGYFGSISNGYDSLLKFANHLSKNNAELRISSFENLDSRTGNHPAIKDIGFIKDRSEFNNYITKNIHVCVVAQSFDLKDKVYLETNFPSKLIDNIAMGMPLLIISPLYSSSAQWALKYHEASIHISKIDEIYIDDAIFKLRKKKTRENLSKNALLTYENYFSATVIQKSFEDAIFNVKTL